MPPTLYGNQPIGTIAYLGGLPSVLEKFSWSMIQMALFCQEAMCGPGEYVHWDRATVSFHSFARNSLVQRFLGDWMLMIDADHAPEPDLPVRMLTLMEQAEEPIEVLSAVYCHRTPPHSPVLYQWNEDETGLLPIGDWDRRVKMLQVGSAGGGSLMVKRSVYERITQELHEEPFDIIPPFGEDHSFFKRCKKLGIPIYAAINIESFHLDVETFGLADYQKPEHGMLSKRLEVGGFG